MPLSIQFPLSIGTQKDFKDFENEKQFVSFQIKNVLYTNPGERISIPSFGVGIKRYLFELNADALSGTLRSRIINQINNYVNGVIIKDVSVFSIEENSLSVQIKYILNKEYFENSNNEILIDQFMIDSNSFQSQVNY